MAGREDTAEGKRLETSSTDRVKLIGQAIIDELIAARSIPAVAADPDYNQGQSGYTQKGGDHKQGGGDYNQSQASILNILDLISQIRPGAASRQQTIQ